MIMHVFAIFDDKAGAFMQPFSYPAVGLAVRAFADSVTDERSPMSRHPGDYELFKIATFDDVKGEFTNLEGGQALGRGSDFVAKKE